MTTLIMAVFMVAAVVLAFYWGRKYDSALKGIADRNDYIRRQQGVIGAMLKAMKNKEEVDEFIKKVDDATTASELTELYKELVSKYSGGGTSSNVG